MKILNLYSGIGGNRKLWDQLGDIDVTAVEYNEEIAMIYQTFFPKDKVIVADAHEYLLNHFQEFDFIWASPPCPTHSRLRHAMTHTDFGNGADRDIKYADMRLYQEILLLDNYFKGKWVVENVVPYYQPLIPAKHLGRHLFWSNFKLGSYKSKESAQIRSGTIKELQRLSGFDLSQFKGIKHRKDTLLRNCVDSELGLLILEWAHNIIRKEDVSQLNFFE